MRLQDLPAKDRRAIRAGDVEVRPAGKRRTRPPSVQSTSRSDTHQCVRCGRTFAGYPSAERHVDGTHGCGRIAVVL